MQYQAPDFGFIAQAGQQVGEGIRGYAKAKKAEQNIKLDDDQAYKAYQAVYKQSIERYMSETGETDPVKAGSFVSKYYQPKMKSETGSQMAARLMTIEPAFEKALKEKKVQIYQQKTAEPAQYQRPETIGKVESPIQRTGLEAQRASEQMGPPAPGQPTRPQYQSSARSVGQMQEAALNEPQAPGVTQGPSMPSTERMGIAERLGVTEEKPVAGNIQRTQNTEVGQDYSPGQNRAAYLAGQAAQGRDVTTGAAKEIASATPTEKDIMTNDRLKAQMEQRAKMAELARRLQEKKLAMEARKQNNSEDYKLLDAQIKLLNTQINASESLMKHAMGIKSGVDPITGTYTFVKDEDFDALQKDNESTYNSAIDLYDRVNKKNEPIIPVIPVKKLKQGDPLGIR